MQLGALARHWLLYDLAELGDLDDAHRRVRELTRLADELQQPLHRHSALAWRGVLEGLAGRFDNAEQLARDSVRLAHGAGAPDAQGHFTAQLVAIRREQGRLGELLSQIGPLARGEAHPEAWRAILPLAYLDAGDESRARAAFERAVGSETRLPTMLWLTATTWLCEAATELGGSPRAGTPTPSLYPLATGSCSGASPGTAGPCDAYSGERQRSRADATRRAGSSRRRWRATPNWKPRRSCARTRCDYGEFLWRREQTYPRARRLLRDAASAAQRLGMTRLAARAARHG